jgi:peptidoglycan/xylan/chitin deacetylase (PgdA/CDA1 family)
MSGAAVLCYHDFVENAAEVVDVPAAHRPYVLTRAQLAAHLDGLVRPEWRASRLADVVAAPAPGRFVLSFDDGHVSNHRIAFPMLAERGWPGCFFVIAGEIGGTRSLSWQELREMHAAGMEIGSHSLTHPFLHTLTPAEVRHEFEESKRRLEDGLGAAVELASLPRGTATAGIAEVLRELGYRAFCVSDPGLVTAATDRFAVPRIAVKRHTTNAFLANVLAGRALTLAGLRSSWAVKRFGKRLIGTDTWRMVRSALTTVADRRAGVA